MTAPVSPEYFVVGPVPSGATFAYSAVLTQLDGVTPIAAGMLQSLTLTFVDVETQAVINSRSAQNVFNLNGVTVDNTGGTGALQWIGGSADNPFLRSDPPPRLGDVERHLAVFSWTWTQGGATYPGTKKLFVVVESYKDVGVEDGGSGADQVVGVVLEPDGVTPVTDAHAWATSDSAGATRLAGPVETDSLGQFLLMLPPGTAYLWANSPSFAVPGPVTVTVPLATSPATVPLTAKIGSGVFWTSRKELERAYGATNVSRWADTENTANEELIRDNIQAAVEDATDEARSLVDNTACGQVVMAPRVLRRNVTRLAAALLYEARGVRDTADDEGRDRMRSSRDRAYKFLNKVASGKAVIEGCVEPTRVPFVSPHLKHPGLIGGPLLTPEQIQYVNEREEVLGVPAYRWFYGDGFDLFFAPCQTQ